MEQFQHGQQRGLAHAGVGQHKQLVVAGMQLGLAEKRVDQFHDGPLGDQLDLGLVIGGIIVLAIRLDVVTGQFQRVLIHHVIDGV